MNNTLQSAPLKNRLLAIVYDVLIIVFIVFIIILVTQQIVVNFELTHLETIRASAKDSVTIVSVIPADDPINLILKNIWVPISLFYFGRFWTKRGQTPGMKAWKVKAVGSTGKLMTWWQAIKRFVFGLLGLGLLWVLIDKNSQALQDKLSNTRLITVESLQDTT